MSSQLDVGAATRHTFDVPGGSIAALRAGAADAPIVLLVPGFTGSKEDFGPLLDPIADAGLQVVAIDLPGQYESPGRGDFSVDAQSTAVRQVAAALGERVQLLGHSFGGFVTRAAVIAEPERFPSLTLLDSGPGGIDGGRRARIDQLRPVLVEYGMAAVYDAMAALATTEPDYVAPRPDVEAFLRKRFLASDPDGLLAMGTGVIDEPDRVDELAATGRPVLVLTGVNDEAFPPERQADMAKRLGAQFVEVPDAGHSPAIENPAATAPALIRFWHAH
ncbi:MAG TPA: alpha/beta hydrolase [Jatrophihabitantaceae bacterium]|jgi:pimeloyl-ACP methyl ester carboxylesterase